MDSKIRDGSYINIQSFMVKDLKLSGNDLLVYAIIYGFSQDCETRFKGSLQYLADWTASTKRGIQKNLANLCEKQLIVKHSQTINNVVFNEYEINWDALNAPKFTSMEQSSIPNEQSSPNNISNNIEKENICINTNTKEIEILNYLNEKAGTRYRTVESNLRLIRGRLKDYTVDDLKKVVDNKVRDWKGTSMQQYLRPETLFGATKIETYLNGLAPTCVEDKKSETKIGFDGQREYAQEEFNDLCANIDNISLDDM